MKIIDIQSGIKLMFLTSHYLIAVSNLNTIQNVTSSLYTILWFHDNTGAFHVKRQCQHQNATNSREKLVSETGMRMSQLTDEWLTVHITINLQTGFYPHTL